MVVVATSSKKTKMDVGCFESKCNWHFDFEWFLNWSWNFQPPLKDIQSKTELRFHQKKVGVHCFISFCVSQHSSFWNIKWVGCCLYFQVWFFSSGNIWIVVWKSPMVSLFEIVFYFQTMTSIFIFRSGLSGWGLYEASSAILWCKFFCLRLPLCKAI